MSVKASVPFNGTKEQEQALAAVFAKYKGVEGGLMPVMQEAQEIYGYLPIEVQKMISDGYGVSLSEIYGIATFYSQFNLLPKGKYKVQVCLGTACYVKGAGNILAEFEKQLGIMPGSCTPDMKFSLDAVRCIGACALAPVLTINEDVYGKAVPSKVADIIAKY